MFAATVRPERDRVTTIRGAKLIIHAISPIQYPTTGLVNRAFPDATRHATTGGLIST
jgi:hypothetical protein